MENIRQAVERAKAQNGPQNGAGLAVPTRRANAFGAARESKSQTEDLELDLTYLQSRRIVAYDGKDVRSRSFDLLRAEVLRSMDLKGWRILAVTSPTPGCGKTLVATNLAFSIGRQPERQVCLVDLDLRKPQLATSLGLKSTEGLLDVIEARIEINDGMIRARAGQSRLEVLPTLATSNASDIVDSTAMAQVLRNVAQYGQSKLIILDLPPLLTGHDGISILPHVDCALLVAAAGHSKISEIEECEKHLESTDVVRFVLNKAPGSATSYAYY